jgi:cytochrome c oxidase subunit IV
VAGGDDIGARGGKGKGRPLLVLFLLHTVLQVLFIAVVFSKHEFGLLDPIVAAYFGNKFVLDFALFAGINLLLVRLFRTAIPAIAFTAFHQTLVAANTAVYFYSNTLLDKSHFALIAPYSLQGYLDWRLILLLALLAASIVAMALALRRLVATARWTTAAAWLALAAALFAADAPRRLAALRPTDARHDRVVMVFRNAQLDYAGRNTLWGFVNDVLLRTFAENLHRLPGSAKYQEYMKNYDLFSDDFQIRKDASGFESVLAAFGIPMGPRQLPDLGLKPFRHVIVVFVESLTLEMLQCHNPDIGVEVSSFLCSDEIRAQTFTDFRTTGSPTLQGLTVLYTSHPNYNIQTPTGDPNSMLKRTREAGYHNVFIRSASKFFANENLIFKRWGFDRIIAREDFHEREELRKFIYGWGLEDRILYDEVVDFIDEHRDRKLFLGVLGTDTHPPQGQREYRHLKYPKLPADFYKPFKGASQFMKAVHHADHDLAYLVDQLKKKGLFTDETLLVLTADHSCPPSGITKDIPNHPRHTMGRAPLVFLTPQKLPAARWDRLASQLDFGPTLFHLMGLPIPQGWWGRSLFDDAPGGLFVGFHQGKVHVEREGEAPILLDARKPDAPEAPGFLELFRTVVVGR